MTTLLDQAKKHQMKKQLNLQSGTFPFQRTKQALKDTFNQRVLHLLDHFNMAK